jgi:hypothetical protein
MNYYMGFDTETGGFLPKKADLLTAFFGMWDEDFKLHEGIYLKLKPNDGRFPIAEAGALNVNKIDLKKHMEDPETITYAEANKKIVALMKKYLKRNGRYSNIRPLGYNVPFDVKWVQEYLVNAEEWESIVHYKDVDVMRPVDFLKDAGWFPPTIGSLESVVEHLQLPKRGAHNSQEDTYMTIDVYKRLLEIMKAKKDGGQAQDLISLLEAE